MTTQTAAPVGGYEIPMYNREGVRISLDEWAMLFSEGRTPADPTAGYHRVAYDIVGPFTISTVWRGFDSREFLGGEPLIFETVIMSPHQGDQIRRQSTEAEARQDHAMCVTKARMAVTVADAFRELLSGDDD